MNWNIIAGAVCGAVASLIVYRLLSRTKLSQTVKSVTSIIVFWLLFTLVKTAGIPMIERYEAWSKLEQMPVFVALKAYEPATYQDIKNSFEVNASSGDAAALRAHGVAVLNSVAAKRLPRASDIAIVEAMTVSMDSLDSLYERGDDTCYQYLFRPEFPQLPIETLLSKELMAADQRTMAEVLRSAAREPMPVPKEEAVVGALRKAAGTLTPKELETFMAGGEVKGKTLVERRAACVMTAKFIRGLLHLPKSEAGPALRYIASVS